MAYNAAQGFEAAQARFTTAVQLLRDEVADLDLTEEERRTLAWLERWEVETLTNVASMIRKARAAGA